MQLVFFDMRGHGRSARSAPETYTLDENVEDMEALRQYLGLGAIVSLGTSYGGRVAIAHAARYPTAVSHLILVATSANPQSVQRAHDIAMERGSAEQIAMCHDFYAGRLDTPAKMRAYFELLGPLYSRRFDPRNAAGLGDTILEPEPLNRAFGPEGYMHALDLRPELATIKVPTLILAGRHDWRCAPEFSIEMKQILPHADLRIFEEDAHTIAADEPENFYDAVVGFLVHNRAGANE
jgi:proline iminopeptidase